MEQYIPLGDELSVEQALVQASQALDITAMLAVENRDTDRLSKTAKDWVKLADFLAALEQHRTTDTKEKPAFGFTAEKKDEVITLNPDFFTEIADDEYEQLEIEFEDDDDV